MRYWRDFDENGNTEHYCIGELEGVPIAVTCGPSKGAQDRAALFAAALNAKEEAEREVVTMNLCEIALLFLKPNQTYRFRVAPNCTECSRLADAAAPDLLAALHT